MLFTIVLWEIIVLTQNFIKAQRRWLLVRKDTKLKILKEGGEQALSHSQNDITRIDFALKRIADDQYGICTNCGCMIAPNRLKVIPETPFCTPCAKETEAQ